MDKEPERVEEVDGDVYGQVEELPGACVAQQHHLTRQVLEQATDTGVCNLGAFSLVLADSLCYYNYRSLAGRST